MGKYAYKVTGYIGRLPAGVIGFYATKKMAQEAQGYAKVNSRIKRVLMDIERGQCDRCGLVGDWIPAYGARCEYCCTLTGYTKIS